MPNKVKILVVGDIIGKGARNAFALFLPKLKERYNYDIIAVNAENTTHGRGLNHKHYKMYKEMCIDILTMGNHVIDNTEIFDYIKETNDLVVPGNVKYKQEEFEKHKMANLIYQRLMVILPFVVLFIVTWLGEVALANLRGTTGLILASIMIGSTFYVIKQPYYEAMKLARTTGKKE